jgi:tetratricopeptide (TPR) repeat protein
LLWADADSERARGSLRQRLFKLRQSAAEDIVVAGDILSLAEGVAHDLGPLAPRLLADPDAGSGDLLGDLDYSDCPGLDEWVEVAREQWRGQRVHALAEIAARFETEQKIAAALPYAERLLADDPTLEHGHRRLMRLHYLRGDRAAALAAYERCGQLLRLQLKVEPSAETQALARLIEQSGQLPQHGPRQLPLSVLRPPRLIGRDAEWAQLEGACDRRLVALVLGEPGIGKSRLIGDFAGHHQGLVAEARPGDARAPYAVLSRLARALIDRGGPPKDDWARAELARLLPELGPAASGKLEAATLHRAARALIDQATGADIAVLVVDDLQFADEATLEALPALAGHARCAWLLAARSGEVPVALAQWLRAQETEVLSTITLAPLTAAGVRQLLESLVIDGLDAEALSVPLTRHTGGNPLFILETLRTALREGATLAGGATALPAPGSVGQLIERRLTQLTPDALNLARVAAIAGPDFSAELVAHVLKQAPIALVDAWRELEAAQIIRDSAFAHDLVFEATQRSISAPIARLLHKDIAAHLEARAGEAASIAHHWKCAQEWAKAGEQYRAAATQMRRLALPCQEMAALANAGECFHRANRPDDRFTSLYDQVLAARQIERHVTVRKLSDELLGIADSAQQRSRAHEARAVVLSDAQEYGAALAEIRSAKAHQDAATPGSSKVAAARIEAIALSRLNRHREALAVLQPMVEGALGSPLEGDHAALLSEYGEVLITCDRNSEAARVLEVARDAAAAKRDWSALYWALARHGWALYCHGRQSESIAQYEQARAIFARLGSDLPPQSVHEVALARQYREVGRFGDALQAGERTVEEQRAGKNPALLAVSSCDLATTYLWLGQIARAHQIIVAPPPGVAPSVLAAYRVTQARLAQAEAKPFRHFLAEALDALESEGRAFYRLRAQLELCRALEPEQGVELARRCLREVESLDLGCLRWAAKAMAADSLRRAGDPSRAKPLADEIVEHFRQSAPIMLYFPEYMSIAGKALAAAGDDKSASEARSTAIRWIRDVALPNVPAEFKDSFVHRNPINRDLLTRADRRPRC